MLFWGIFLLYGNLHKFGNWFIDTYRDPWVSMKLAQGQVLYRDVHYLFGLLPPYLLALFFKIAGMNMDSAIALGLISGALITLSLHRLFRLFLNPLFSALLIIHFLGVFALSIQEFKAIFNYLLPYSFASTLSLLFILGSLLSLERLLSRPGLANSISFLLMTGCIFLCRIEYGLIVSLVYGITSLATIRQGKGGSLFWLTGLSALWAFAVYALFLSLHHAWGGFKESILDHYFYIASGQCYFNKGIAGFDSVGPHLLLSAKSFFVWIVFSLLPAVIASLWKRKNQRGLLIHSLFLSLILFFIFLKILPYKAWYAYLPFLCLSGFLLKSIQIFFPSKESHKESLYGLALFGIGFVLSLRIFLAASPDGYGFYLLVPGLLCHFLFLMKLLPEFLDRAFPNAGVSAKMTPKVILLISLLLILPYFKTTSRFLALKTLSVETPLGSSDVAPVSMTYHMAQAATYLKEHSENKDTLVVFPEGVSLNFFSGLMNPLRYDEFVPSEIDRFTEDRIIHLLSQQGITYIAVLGIKTTPYREVCFGLDYGKKIMEWIGKNYELATCFGPMPFSEGEKFGLALYRKKETHK